MMNADVTDLIGWAADAAKLIAEFRAYAEEMRKHGRGFEPVGILGHSAASVELGLRGAIAKVDRPR